MPVYLTPPPRNPLVQAIAAVIGVVLMVGAFMIGLVAFAAIAGLALLAGLVAWVRMAWLRRKGVGTGPQRPQPDATQDNRPSATIEAEYTVVSRSEDTPR